MKEKRKRSLTLSGHSSVLLMMALSLLISALAMPTQAQAASAKAPDKIRIGNAISLSGPYAPGAITTQTNPYDMWVKEVNEKGGIYVKAYGKKIPVELIRYDDKSDMGTVVKLVEKLILDDKVDLLLPPWGTAMNFAIAPIVTRHKYPVLGVTVDSMKLKEMAPTIPYLFIVLNQPPVKADAIVPLCKELGVKTAAVVHHTDLHGIEFAGYVMPQLSVNGIDVVLYKTYPLGAKDLSPLLKKVKAADVDAFFAFSYPPETFLLTQQAKAVEFNPKLFYTSIGTAFAA
ncbi:MAG: amino acid ABC transporter substrate-binding protein, partial [Proteobacteria bacterium]|nr:amino acid ABC transporter substrate-binding protein [Pseudomonadota bacterium]